jgi:hypothetical protein
MARLIKVFVLAVKLKLVNFYFILNSYTLCQITRFIFQWEDIIYYKTKQAFYDVIQWTLTF